MWTDGQRLERNEVDGWISEAFQFPYFRAAVQERDDHLIGQTRVTMTVSGPNGEPLVDNGRTAVYYSMRAISGIAQLDADWVI